MTDGNRLRGAVQQRAQQATRPGNSVATRDDQIQDLFAKNRDAMARALPGHMNADRMIRIGLTVIAKTPRLAQCTDLSLLGALMLSAQLGLEPGPLGHCYFLPFKNFGQSKSAGYDVYEVQWILGYTGIIELARRSYLGW